MIFGLYHSETETAGRVGDLLKAHRLPFTDVHLYAGHGLPRETGDLEGLIVMGGPMNVDDIHSYPFLLPEVQLIERVLTDGKPVLGICLGAQLIAKALGSRVYRNKTKEMGWGPITMTAAAAADPLFRLLPARLDVLHWHGDTFDLPPGAVHLARSADCENQAFRWGENAYALQFHLEATPAMARTWCETPDGAAELKAAGADGKRIVRQAGPAYQRLLPHADAFFTGYLRTFFKKLLPVA